MSEQPPRAINNESVDSYLEIGCGRCDRFRTPACKVHRWPAGLRALRAVLQQTELEETMKWGSPTYTIDGKNLIMIGAFNDDYRLSLLNGAALDDPDAVLEKPGPNSHYARIVRFREDADAGTRTAQLADYVARAIAAHKAGVSIEKPKDAEPMPEELQAALDADPELQAAWDALTPGRQRSHILQVGGAKQAATRERRAQACAPKILAGKGFLDR